MAVQKDSQDASKKAIIQELGIVQKKAKLKILKKGDFPIEFRVSILPASETLDLESFEAHFVVDLGYPNSGSVKVMIENDDIPK
ncbi:MAG: hypothetical protein EZS28_026882 [Streblomastix strix]|uniref:Uncharacterized protein n=1 Tax=Streblomastix strix TaxID=222440 RepID=A0A5J4V5F5_9EUKA|nr:MAG: hypothetical protein EZS28_026882 [Streblomastix strix]